MDNQILMSTYRREEIMEMVAQGVAKGVAEALDSMMNKKEQMFTIDEAAKYCKVTPRSIHNWTNRGLITAHKIGGRTLYKETELEEAMKRKIIYRQTY